MSETVPTLDVIIGVDTHKLTHAAAAINVLGTRLGAITIPVSGKGYQALEAWARSLYQATSGTQPRATLKTQPPRSR